MTLNFIHRLHRSALKPLIGCLLLAGLCLMAETSTTARADSGSAVYTWKDVADRPWPGSAFWANRLSDWSVKDGALQCVYGFAGDNWRTAHLLTNDLIAHSTEGDGFTAELTLQAGPQGRAGLLLGAGEGGLNYKQAAVVQSFPGTGGGLLVEVDFKTGVLAIRDFGEAVEQITPSALNEQILRDGSNIAKQATLRVVAEPLNNSTLKITATLTAGGGTDLATTSAEFPAARMAGSIAIASLGATEDHPHRFHRLAIAGGRVAEHPERAFGPVAGVVYSVANGDLKIGVQCVALGRTLFAAPWGEQAKSKRVGVQLERQTEGGQWVPVDYPVGVSHPDYYALMRVRNYDQSKAQTFRITMVHWEGEAEPYQFHVPAAPEAGEEVVVGAVSCTGALGRKGLNDPSKLQPGEAFTGRWTPANVWVPWQGVSETLMAKEPDIVFFSGDQLYENNPTPMDPSNASPIDDYFYKWMLWHWSFQNITANVPTVMQTDDHDVWHPNLWGEGGRLMTEGWDAGGGYLKNIYFVNMVHRTMCGHNPDAYHPRPLDSGVTNYYTTFNYAGVDFAVLEDRKFKKAIYASARPDLPETMLGEDQLSMLREWADAETDAVARIVVSQTNYASVNTKPQGQPFGDHDTNGWPKKARDEAVELFADAGAVLFTGDQHLASVSRLVTDDPNKSVVQFCQPAGGCIWWRWFYPNEAFRQGQNNTPNYLGTFADPFGNVFETMAIANPHTFEENARLTNPQKYILTAAEQTAGVGTRYRQHQAEGVALIRVQPAQDKLTLECWPDPSSQPIQEHQQFTDWPIELKLSEIKSD